MAEVGDTSDPPKPVEPEGGSQANGTKAKAEGDIAPPAEMPLGRAALQRLLVLKSEIDTMLSYATRNGLVLPDELREKVSELLQHPALAEAQTPAEAQVPAEVQTTKRQGGSRWWR